MTFVDPQLIVPLIVILLLLGIMLVLSLSIRRFYKRTGRIRRTYAIEMPCTVCQSLLTLQSGELIPLTPPELGMVVCVHPELNGRKLAEYRCLHCDALHYFMIDVNPPLWVAENIYEPQSKKSTCSECRKPLKRPGWQEGLYDGRIEQAPNLEDSHGLVCSHCGAACCFKCCRFVTRNRTNDGSLLCPRCSRGPVDKVYHF